MAMSDTMRALICAMCLLGACQAQDLIIFGDSLTDSGPRAVGGGYMKWMQETLRTDLEFPSFPYGTGRYSNGPVWPEYASEDLGIDFVNWAAGGATSGAGISQAGALPASLVGANADLRVLAPNLLQQLNQYYLSTNNTANSEDIYVIFMGNNDYFSVFNDGKNVTADEVVGFINEAFESLYNHGARKFIVVTIPPVAALPKVFLENQEFVQAWSEHNELLTETFADFNSTHSDAVMYTFDFGLLVIKVAFNAANFGFTDALTPCLQTRSASYAIANGVAGCSNPDQHLFCDTEHPTTAAHKIIGEAFAQQFASLFGKTLTPAEAPAPAAVLSGGRRLK